MSNKVFEICTLWRQLRGSAPNVDFDNMSYLDLLAFQGNLHRYHQMDEKSRKELDEGLEGFPSALEAMEAPADHPVHTTLHQAFHRADLLREIGSLDRTRLMRRDTNLDLQAMSYDRLLAIRDRWIQFDRISTALYSETPEEGIGVQLLASKTWLGWHTSIVLNDTIEVAFADGLTKIISAECAAPDFFTLAGSDIGVWMYDDENNSHQELQNKHPDEIDCIGRSNLAVSDVIFVLHKLADNFPIGCYAKNAQDCNSLTDILQFLLTGLRLDGEYIFWEKLAPASWLYSTFNNTTKLELMEDDSIPRGALLDIGDVESKPDSSSRAPTSIAQFVTDVAALHM